MGRFRLSSPRGFALSRLIVAGSLSGAAVLGLAVPAAAGPAAQASDRAAQQAESTTPADAAGSAAPQGNAYGHDRSDATADQSAANQSNGADRSAKDAGDNPGLAKGHKAAPSAQTSSPATTPAKQSSTSSASHTCSSKTVGNGGGANGSGAYGSTCDGSASLNGNGGGTAGGKPCAGCVGSADDKNPPGQRPNGSDHNAGYECDRNRGVGRGNPAHSACTKTTVPPTTVPPTTVPPTTIPPTTVPPTTVPPTTKPPKKSLPVIDAEVAGIDTARTPEVAAQAASPVTPADIPRGLLAMTGLPLSMLVTLGTAALGGGSLAVAVARRRNGK